MAAVLLTAFLASVLAVLALIRSEVQCAQMRRELGRKDLQMAQLRTQMDQLRDRVLRQDDKVIDLTRHEERTEKDVDALCDWAVSLNKALLGGDDKQSEFTKAITAKLEA